MYLKYASDKKVVELNIFLGMLSELKYLSPFTMVK